MTIQQTKPAKSVKVAKPVKVSKPVASLAPLVRFDPLVRSASIGPSSTTELGTPFTGEAKFAQQLEIPDDDYWDSKLDAFINRTVVKIGEHMGNKEIDIADIMNTPKDYQLFKIYLEQKLKRNGVNVNNQELMKEIYEYIEKKNQTHTDVQITNNRGQTTVTFCKKVADSCLSFAMSTQAGTIIAKTLGISSNGINWNSGGKKSRRKRRNSKKSKNNKSKKNKRTNYR